MNADSVRHVAADFVDADLGDARRTERLVQMITKLAKDPSRTLPEAMGTEADLEAAYRFANNPAIGMDDILESHAAQTVARARASGEKLVAICDTTPIRCPHAKASDVGYLNTGKAGFYLHYSLLVGAASRRPFGVTSLETVVRKKAPSKRRAKRRQNASGAQTSKKENREFDRWKKGIDATAALTSGCEVVYVADRETDSYELMAECLKSQRRFVFRVRIGARNAQLDDGETGTIEELASRAEGVLIREVPVAARRAASAPKAAKAHPPRKSRIAELHYSATPVILLRPRYLDAELPTSIRLNLVRVWEPKPPKDAEPVEWMLFTTERISTPKKIAEAVDLYRARWLIEECNKALKSGCLIEQREFESLKAMETMVAVSLPIAVQILAIRTAAREKPNRLASELLSGVQIKILRQLGPRKLDANPKLVDALLAIAALGGHQKSNGDPGWLVLQRGMTKLLAYEAGWRAREAAGL